MPPLSSSDAPRTASDSVNKWVIAATVIPGTFLAVMDITVVNTAMPDMMGYFGQTLSDIAWIGTAYSIAEIIMITMSGWWSRVVGRRRLYLFSLWLFTIGSVLTGQAHSFPELLFFRVLQGIGGGSLIPIVQATLREVFPPEEQGLAMGLFGMAVVVAPAIGPVLGGWLTDHWGWRWVFYINVPVAAFGIMMAMEYLRDSPHERRGVSRVDWQGIALLSVGLSALQIVMERGQEKDWFASNEIRLGLIGAVLSLVALVIWELRTEEPIIDLRLFRNVPLASGSVVCFITTMALYGTTFIMPELLQNLLGYSAFQSGLTLLPRALILFAMMPLVGWLYNLVDARVLIISGAVILWYSYYLLARLPMDVAFWNLIPIMLIMGAGQPFTFVTLSTAALSTVERRDLTHAASLFTLSRRVGGNIAYALMASVVDRRIQFHHARLAESASWANPYFTAARATLAGTLATKMAIPGTRQSAIALLNGIVNQQATMLAYNDSSWLMGVIVLIAVPFVFLLPGRPVREAASAAAEAME